MMDEFGDSSHRRMEADDPYYDSDRPHEHHGPNDPEHHIEDDTGHNDELQDRFGSLCRRCRERGR
jgi:hypothetical protein